MLKKIIFVGTLCVVVLACSQENTMNTELEKAKVKWQSFGYENYRITERYSCFCGGLLEWETVVLENVKDTVYFDPDRLSPNQTYQDVLENARTIADAFRFIEDFDVNSVDFFKVEYDEKYGFPAVISIDYHYNTADDEISYLYQDFKPFLDE